MALRKFVLDTNCYIGATQDAALMAALDAFQIAAAPRLYLSSVVASELRMGVRSPDERRELDRFINPFERRKRILTPSAAAWSVLGTTLARLVETEGLVLNTTPRSFIFDILIAQSCRDAGLVLVSSNTRDLARIARVFSFEFAEPYPDPSAG